MIYERIKELCKTNGISVNQLEAELEIAKGSLCKIDKHKPSTEKIQILADRLGTSVTYLMSGKEPSESKYSTEMAHLVSKIRNDAELSKALLLYFELPENKKKHVVDTIKILSEVWLCMNQTYQKLIPFMKI